MEFFTDELMGELCSRRASRPRSSARTASGTSAPAPARRGRNIDWLTIPDAEQSVVDDVARIRAHPLVPGRIPIYGYIYDVTTGRLNEVAAATHGRPEQRKPGGCARARWSDDPDGSTSAGAPLS